MTNESEKLQGIGFWRDETPAEFPEPQALGTIVYPRKGRLLGYLMAGKPIRMYMGFSFCRFKCGVSDPELGCRDFTDGRWAWPEGLAHYVECHDIKLPDEFLRHVASNKYVIPNNIICSDSQVMEYSFKYWTEWSKANSTQAH